MKLRHAVAHDHGFYRNLHKPTHQPTTQPHPKGSVTHMGIARIQKTCKHCKQTYTYKVHIESFIAERREHQDLCPPCTSGNISNLTSHVIQDEATALRTWARTADVELDRFLTQEQMRERAQRLREAAAAEAFPQNTAPIPTHNATPALAISFNILYNLTRQGSESVTSRDLHSARAANASTKLSQRSIASHLAKLEVMGLIATELVSRGRYGLHQEIRLTPKAIELVDKRGIEEHLRTHQHMVRKVKGRARSTKPNVTVLSGGKRRITCTTNAFHVLTALRTVVTSGSSLGVEGVATLADVHAEVMASNRCRTMRTTKEHILQLQAVGLVEANHKSLGRHGLVTFVRLLSSASHLKTQHDFEMHLRALGVMNPTVWAFTDYQVFRSVQKALLAAPPEGVEMRTSYEVACQSGYQNKYDAYKGRIRRLREAGILIMTPVRRQRVTHSYLTMCEDFHEVKTWQEFLGSVSSHLAKRMMSKTREASNAGERGRTQTTPQEKAAT